MSSINALARGNAGTRKFIIAGAIAVPVALFVVWTVHTAAAYRAVIEQDRANEMAAESRALCAKWGVPESSAKYSDCVADIQSVRNTQVQRTMEDAEPM